jgi:hypothetical protein
MMNFEVMAVQIITAKEEATEMKIIEKTDKITSDNSMSVVEEKALNHPNGKSSSSNGNRGGSSSSANNTDKDDDDMFLGMLNKVMGNEERATAYPKTKRAAVLEMLGKDTTVQLILERAEIPPASRTDFFEKTRLQPNGGVNLLLRILENCSGAADFYDALQSKCALEYGDCAALDDYVQMAYEAVTEQEEEEDL